MVTVTASDASVIWTVNSQKAPFLCTVDIGTIHPKNCCKHQHRWDCKCFRWQTQSKEGERALWLTEGKIGKHTHTISNRDDRERAWTTVYAVLSQSAHTTITSKGRRSHTHTHTQHVNRLFKSIKNILSSLEWHSLLWFYSFSCLFTFFFSFYFGFGCFHINLRLKVHCMHALLCKRLVEA